MKAKGIYVSPTEFVSFAERDRAQRRSLADDIATRQRSPDFTALGMYLPNPDPILKKQGKDISVYTDLRSDALVGGSIRRRKAGVVKMEWRVEREKASSRMHKLCEKVLGELDMERLIRETLDAPLFGYQPLEVMWSSGDGALVPLDVVAKPANWFQFDSEAQLRFKSREQPLFGELLQPRKFLVPAQDASYANPYGFPDLSMVFWPTVFKRGGLKFWVTFTEKFGTPWLVGKVPRNTAPKEQDDLLDQLEAMVQDAVAVIPDDASVEVVEAGGKTGSADLYERLLMFCRSEISIALLGQNQTTESNANRASAEAGLQVTEELRDSDARLVETTVNQLLRWMVDLNEGEGAPAPKLEFFEQEEVDKVQAERDEILVRAGCALTQKYFMRTYDLEEGDIEVAPPPPDPSQQLPEQVPAKAAEKPAVEPVVEQPGPAFADAAPGDALDGLIDVAAADWQPVMAPMVEPLQALLQDSAERGETAAELLARLPDALQAMDAAPLQQALARASFTARVAAEAGLQPDGSEDGLQVPEQGQAAFAEPVAAPAPVPPKVEVHFHMPAGQAPVVQNTVVVPEQAAPVVQNTVVVPEQPAPVVQNTVMPSEVTVIGAHPTSATQTVERNENDEVIATVTSYHFGEGKAQ